jgi:2-polyprenyl-3-methyl-5-hydroxy-6-metoxy-1,4-benzoquinol methylase
MNQSELEKLKNAEAKFFDEIADLRTQNGHIPLEADIRRATKFIPKRSERLPVIDPEMNKILDAGAREKYLDMVAHKPGGRVLDICCGSGWLALELGRRGQFVDAYDLSPKAIALAKKTLEENPFQEGFGQVNYHLQDVSEIDLGVEKYDAVSGWAAFHHLPDAPAFLERVQRALKPGGIVATYDDLSMGRIEKTLELFLRFVLPQCHYSYLQKLSIAIDLLLRRKRLPEEIFSPMEEAKHCSVEDIARILHEQFEVLLTLRKNAFVGTPLMTMSGPDWFRYSTARALVALDHLLCQIGLVKGFDQIIVARKK